ncbi:MAG: pilus assembly protein PilP [Geobacteraceae bacterium]|nr:pilus assembly protein PilP [Geobacteraceae bacterium]
MIKNVKNKVVFLTFFFAVLPLCLVGCDKKAPPPKAKPPVTKPVAKKPVVQQQLSSATGFKTSAVAVDFATKKDPFKAYVTSTKGPLSPKRNRYGQIIPILNYDLTQFSVKGIIVGLKENSALILDPTGKPYVVKAGMEIGRNEGKITKITSTYIEVFEQYRDEAGKLKKSTTKLMLPKKE